MPETTLLRRALRANAAFSTFSAVAFLAAGDPIARATGLPEGPLLPGLGLGLLGFAAFLVFAAARQDPARLRGEGLLACIGDFAWVAGALPVIALGPMNTTGNVALAAISTAVLGLGLAQLRGVRRIASAVAA